jgi:hypothetical protein
MVTPAGGAGPPGAQDIDALRNALMDAHDKGDLAEERRLSGLLKQVDTKPIGLGDTTMKAVSPDSMYQPGFKPLDEAGAFLSSTINQIPIAGPALEKGVADIQANLHNILKPDDIPITQLDVLNTHMQSEAANPKGTFAGKIAGNAAPYMLASKFALPAKMLGLEGSLFSRLGLGSASQFAINTGDNMTRNGDDLPKAATDAILPTLLTAPLSLFGSPTRAGRVITSELQRAGISPDEVKAALDEIGPNAVIGDLSPRLQARIGAVATLPGPGQDLVVNALRERAAKANPRIKGAIETTFGPDPVPSKVAAEIDQARVTANEAYPPVLRDKALSENYLYDAKPLADALNKEVPNFVGETRTKIQSVRDMLVNPETGALTTDPQTILAVRHEIDGMINAMKGAQGGNTTTIQALSDMRKMIDEDLAQQVPGIKWADAGRAEVAAQAEGFDLGRKVLSGGEDAIHPDDLQAMMDTLRGPKGSAVGPRSEPSLAPLRVSEGTLSKIYQIVGTTANDRVALKGILKGEGSWNRDKLITVFGQEKADALIRLLEGEARMAETEALAFGNSKTEMLRSAKTGMEQPSSDGVVKALLNAKFGDAIWRAGDRLTGGVASAERRKSNEAVARALLARSVQAGRNPSSVPQGISAVARALIAANSQR